MKNKRAHQLLITTIAIALLLAMIPTTGHTAIPQKINYQGYVTDPQGTPIDDTVTITFSIYPNTTDEAPLWTETQTVTVTDGVFSVDFGNATPLNLPFDTPYYLGITIGSDSEMTPRQPLTTVGYAFRAKEADSVKDGAVTNTVISDGAVTTDKISDDAISGDKIAQGAVTSTNIANGSVGSGQIGDGSIATQDLADDAVTVEKISPTLISSINGVTNDGGNVDLEAGSNITITPDDAANKITIAASGGGSSSLWTESGGNVYRSSGKVGIGTATPGLNLEINQNVDALVGLYITNPNTGNSSSEGIYFNNEDGAVAGIRLNNDSRMNIFNNRPNGSIHFGTQGPSITLANSGNLGIGTENPNYRLEINGTTVIGSDSKGIRMRTDSFFVDLESLDSDLSINHISGFNTLLNADSGKVGIGTWFPDQKLTIQGESGDYAIVKINQIGDPMWIGLELDRDGTEKWFIGMSHVSDDLLFRRSASSNDMVIDHSGNVGIAGDVGIYGNLTVSGSKGFAHPHPGDPSKQIVYVCLEGGESGVYVRGTNQLKNGRVEIDLPEHFVLVASEDGLTVQVTPLGDCFGLFVHEKSLDRIIIRESQDGKSSIRFDYLVMGIRRGFENHKVIQEKAQHQAKYRHD